MKDITRYTYLNLETRPDRRLLAQCTAWRDRIPTKLVHFWTGEWFETLDEIGKRAVEQHGFENFKPCIGNDQPASETIVGQVYNILCYLTDRIKRKDTLEVFLHDDTYFDGRGQAHDHLNDLCRTVRQHNELNIVLLDPFFGLKNTPNHLKDIPIFRPNGLDIGDLVYEGNKSECDFAMILSAKGAEYLRSMMLNHSPWYCVEKLLRLGEWNLPGIFTTTSNHVKRYPVRFTGSGGSPASL